ncbi:MAG: zinc ribbon domain-containing protein [Phycisphaerae bacterium]
MTDDGESWDVVPCPSCGKEIAEGVEFCQHCGDAVIHPRPQLTAGWAIFGGLMLVALVVMAIR